MPKNGVHFTAFIAKSESCEFYEVRGTHSITGFLAIFVVGSLKAAMKFAMKFYRAVKGIVVSKSWEGVEVIPSTENVELETENFRKLNTPTADLMFGQL